MASEPSLAPYIVGSVFMTGVVGVFAAIAAGSGGTAALLAIFGFLAAYSTIHLVATNALVRNWLRYVAEEDPFAEEGDEATERHGPGDGTQ